MSSKSSSPGTILKRADPSTIQAKFLVGYQGWFTCPGDGEPVGPGHHGWLHWFNHPIPEGGRPNTDVWPDVSSYSPSELFPAPGLKTKSGEQTFLFSSRNSKTVRRHFHWMAEHGVDGAFLQRFAGQCDMESGNEGIRRIRDEVGERVREAAEQEGRVFAIMYDVSGVPSDRIQNILERDWVHLVRNLGVLDSPNYLKEKGKPVVALWGFGFDNSGHSPALVRAIIQYLRNTTPGGVYIMGGAPTHWRTSEGDADRNPGFLDVWLDEFDAISPWTIGRYRTEQEADNFAETKMKGDLALIKKRNEEGTMRKIDYIPVVLPGGSGHNLSEGKWGFNDIKREGGRFLWRQIYNARRLGVRTIYGAMWDEYDEGTAFMPIVEHKRNLPESNKYPFLALDEDGYDVPSDWYMRICGFAAEGLRNERRVLETFPVKELQDYWSSRPRYEDVNPKSKEFASGSTSMDKTGNIPASDGGVDPGDPAGGGQAYQEWLALQKEEKDEVPPPPYTLEADESTDPDPSQAITNVNARATAVATTSEVPSVAIHGVPVVNVQPVASSSHAVASPPAVNNSTYPTSAVPVSQEQHAVSAQSPQPTLPIRGQSPQLPSGLHHTQSRPPSRAHSPHPYPPSGTAQHSPQSRPATQVHSPSPQPFPPTAGQSAQSYPPPAGTQHPQLYSTSQPYPPAQSYHPQYATTQGQSPQGQPSHAHSPAWGQSYSPTGGPSYQGYPASTGHSHGHPPAGVPSQGYIPPNVQSAQSRPASGGPVGQGYPPVDGSSPHSYTSSHNTFNTSHEQPHDPVATLASDFGRQSISRPGGVRPGGGLSTPPPQHPARPGNSGYTNRPPRPSTAQPRPTSPLSLPAQETSAPTPSTQNRPRWPPAEWDLDSSPVQHFTSQPGRRPSAGAPSGANLTRPQTYSASSSSTAGGSAVRPTSSMSNKPPPRPNTASGMNMHSGHYSPPIAESTYNNNDHSASSSYLPTGGPPMHSQHGPPMGFPAGPQYNPTPSSYYAGQQGASTYGSAMHGSSYVSTSTAWPGSGHVSSSHSPPIEFPGSQMGYGASGSQYGSGVGGSQYHGGPPFPSNTSSPTGVQFPQAHGGGDGGYFGGNMPSSSTPFSGYGGGGGSPPGFPSSGPSYPQASSEPWIPPIHTQSGGSSMDYPSPGGSKPSSFPIVSSAASGALGLALDTVDKVAGRRKRDQLESRVESLTQNGSKLFSKFTK